MIDEWKKLYQVHLGKVRIYIWRNAHKNIENIIKIWIAWTILEINF